MDASSCGCVLALPSLSSKQAFSRTVQAQCLLFEDLQSYGSSFVSPRRSPTKRSSAPLYKPQREHSQALEALCDETLAAVSCQVRSSLDCLHDSRRHIAPSTIFLRDVRAARILIIHIVAPKQAVQHSTTSEMPLSHLQEYNEPSKRWQAHDNQQIEEGHVRHSEEFMPLWLAASCNGPDTCRDMQYCILSKL